MSGAALLTPERCREARSMAGLTVGRLALESNVSDDTIKRFEAGQQKPRTDTLIALLDTFESHGVAVTREGVRWASEPWKPEGDR